MDGWLVDGVLCFSGARYSITITFPNFRKSYDHTDTTPRPHHFPRTERNERARREHRTNVLCRYRICSFMCEKERR